MIQRLNNPQTQLLALLIFRNCDILDVPDHTQIMYTSTHHQHSFSKHF